jgi:hypothetical protein
VKERIMSTVIDAEEAIRRRFDEAAMRKARREVVARARQFGRPLELLAVNDDDLGAA